MLVFAILPHHHHEEVACVAVDYCEQNNAINDEHTNGSEIPEDDHDGSCISEMKFIVSNFKNETKCNVFSFKDYNHKYLFSIYFLVAGLFNFDTRNFHLKTKCEEYISFYKSVKASQFHGLRAPPTII